MYIFLAVTWSGRAHRAKQLFFELHECVVCACVCMWVFPSACGVCVCVCVCDRARVMSRQCVPQCRDNEDVMGTASHRDV